MRKLVSAGVALGFGIALSVPAAAAAAGGTTIVVNPGQSIQAAVNQAQPGDTVLVKPGVYHQSVLIKHGRDHASRVGGFPRRHGHRAAGQPAAQPVQQPAGLRPDRHMYPRQEGESEEREGDHAGL